MKMGFQRVSKRTWYDSGGFANPRAVRRMIGGSWRYYFNWY